MPAGRAFRAAVVAVVAIGAAVIVIAEPWRNDADIDNPEGLNE